MSEEYKGYTYKIEPDTDPLDPRKEWDNLGTMLVFHRNYNHLGDDIKIDVNDFNSIDEVREHVRLKLKGYIILPLYIYEHGGITMNTTGFNCQWDSSTVGFIYMTAEKIRYEYSAKRISKKLKERVTKYLVGEVETYDQYLTGDVWGYTEITNPDGEELEDSCWGFFGDKYVHEEAKATIDLDIKIEKELQKVRDISFGRLPRMKLEYRISKQLRKRES